MNQETQKKRIGLVIGIILFLLGMLFSLTVTIEEIIITGNEKYTDEQMMEFVFPQTVNRNALFCYVTNQFVEQQEIPFVERYDMIFHTPTQVEVIVYEKSMVGYVSYMSSYMYFDKDGIIVESANSKLEGIPWITGLNFGHIALYQKLPVDTPQIFEDILNLTQILSIFELDVDEVRYNSFLEATLYMGDIEVILGNNEELNGKISTLNDMLPQLEGLQGILYLDTYNQMSAYEMYTFHPVS